MTEEASALSTEDLRLRRRHAAAGVVALGSFLVLHLLVQGTALRGAAAWEHTAGTLARSTAITMATVLFVLFPLAFHVALGITIARRPVHAADVVRYGSMRRVRTQRWSGIALLVFILWHAWSLAGQRAFLGMSAAESFTRLEAQLSSTVGSLPLVALGTIFGVGLACLHLANGLFAASRLFGIGEGPRMRVVTTLLGAVLFVLGTSTVVGIATGTGWIPDAPVPDAPCAK